MRFFWERWGFTREEWDRISDYYAELGERLAPDEETLERFKGLVEERRIEAALHLLCYHYGTPPVSVVRKRKKDKLFGGYDSERRKIVLFDLAFKDPKKLPVVILHEFAHHLQETKYPFHLHDERLGRMHEEDPESTYILTELFALRFTKGLMDKLGLKPWAFVWV